MSGSQAWCSGIRSSSQIILIWSPALHKCRSSTDWEKKETLLLEDALGSSSHALGTRVKHQLHRSGPEWTLGLEGLLGSHGVSVDHCGSKETSSRASGNNHSLRSPRDCGFGPIQQPAGSSAGMPEAKQPTLWEHSKTQQQTSHLKSSWAHSCL